MNKKELLFIVGILLFISGCAANQVPVGAVSADKSDEGIQIVKLGIDKNGYTPNPITVKVNEPVRLVKGKSLTGCAAFVVQEELGIKANFMNSNEYEFTPSKKGVYSFSCSMGMYKGVLQIV